jgi:hypothetical protein
MVSLLKFLQNESEGSEPGQKEIWTQLLVFRQSSKGAAGLYHTVNVKVFWMTLNAVTTGLQTLE